MIESIGDIRLFPGGYVPEGYLVCNGQYLSTSDPKYTELYKVIGTRFGSRWGQFRLPDLEGTKPVRAVNGRLEPEYDRHSVSYRGTTYPTREKVVTQVTRENSVHYLIRYSVDTDPEVLNIVHTDRDTNPTRNSWKVWYKDRLADDDVIARIVDIIGDDRDLNEDSTDNEWKAWLLRRLQDEDVIARLCDIFDEERGKSWLLDDMLEDDDVKSKITAICQDDSMLRWIQELVDTSVRAALENEKIRKKVEFRN